MIEKALALGASAAGIADVAALRTSPSHHAVTAVRWPPDAASVVVLALEHSPDEPVMDWWDHRTGGTPGNRRLITIGTALVRWLNHEHAIIGRGVPYPIAKGGFFVKDAAVLAGLGVIGRNNLLITPCLRPPGSPAGRSAYHRPDTDGAGKGLRSLRQLPRTVSSKLPPERVSKWGL